MHRIYLAFLVFFRILFGKPLPADPMLKAPEPQPALPPPTLEKVETKEVIKEKPQEKIVEKRVEVVRTEVGALQLLALFQREGRLVDFLNESIDSYDDAAIGAAVRDIHRGCKKVLAEHLGLSPVLDGAEDEAITVDKGFDPGKIRLVGNVAGEPPFKGTLRHHGWRAVKVAMPTLSDGVDPMVVAPAEVELP